MDIVFKIGFTIFLICMTISFMCYSFTDPYSKTTKWDIFGALNGMAAILIVPIMGLYAIWLK